MGRDGMWSARERGHIQGGYMGKDLCVPFFFFFFFFFSDLRVEGALGDN